MPIYKMSNQHINVNWTNQIKSIFMINTYSFWLINPSRTEIKRFLKNNKSEDRYFEYMFVDTGEIIGTLGDTPPLLKTRVSIKINKAREIYKRLLSQGWKKTNQIW